MIWNRDDRVGASWASKGRHVPVAEWIVASLSNRPSPRTDITVASIRGGENVVRH